MLQPPTLADTGGNFLLTSTNKIVPSGCILVVIMERWCLFGSFVT
jgi:hypothetical protein